VPENRVHKIELNGSVKEGIVAVFIESKLPNNHLACYVPPHNVTPFECTWDVDLRMGDLQMV